MTTVQYKQFLRIDKALTFEVPITSANVPIEIPFPEVPQLKDKYIYALYTWGSGRAPHTVPYVAPSGNPIVPALLLDNSYLILRKYNKVMQIRKIPMRKFLYLNPSIYPPALLDYKLFDWSNCSILIAYNAALPVIPTVGNSFMFTVYYVEKEKLNWYQKQVEKFKQLYA